MILTVQIETENHMLGGDYYVQNLVQNSLKTELDKKKHKQLGEVKTCHVFQQGPLEEAAWNFARQIREAAADAVSDRIN